MSETFSLNEVFLRPTYRDDYARAKVHQTCILCNRPAADFRNTSAKLEYTVSALCQQCQDRTGFFKRRLA